MAPLRWFRRLLTDPPIRDRLAWRGLLTPSPEQDSDPALKASTLGLMLSAGTVAAILGVVTDQRMVNDDALMIAVAGISAAIAITCLLGYRRLPRLFFIAANAVAIGLIFLAAEASADRAIPVYAPIFAIAVLTALVLFRALPAVGIAALATLAYAILLFGRDDPFDFELWSSTTVMVIAFAGVIGVLRRRATVIRGELSSEAVTDSLTGLPNRRAFDERIELELERAAREDDRVGLVIADLDHFKRVNDSYGHDLGDRVLDFAADVMERSVRTVDLAARIGGEEFALILPGASTAESVAIAQRVRRQLARRGPVGPVSITASFGVASLGPERLDAEELYRLADEAMYAAKAAGRDCIAAMDGGEPRVVDGGTRIGRIRQAL